MAKRRPADAIETHVARWATSEGRRPSNRPAAGPGQESVWDYPRPPRLEPVGRRVTVLFGGVTIADSVGALRMLETSHPPTYYLPPDDVLVEHLIRSDRRGSFCEWKGQARYWHLQVGERRSNDVAWSYPDPFEEYANLRDHLAFYCAAMELCRVGEAVASPQPGGFYGGWVTPELVGPFKGEPGSEGW